MNAPTALLSRETAREVVEISGKACSRCKTKERAPHQRYCRYCHAEYMRERRVLRRDAQRHLEEALQAIASGHVADACAVAREALSYARLR